MMGTVYSACSENELGLGASATRKIEMATYDRQKPGAVGRAAAACFAAIILAAVPMSAAFAAQHAAGKSTAASGEAATPPEIAEFMALLANPKVQKWLLEEQHAAEAAEKPAKPHEETVSEYIDSRIGATREHIS
jgi:hypothetical protein